MGFFSKRNADGMIYEKSEDGEQKVELKSKIENIQNEFRTKQQELNDITQKFNTVKEEYNTVVGNLMLVKKVVTWRWPRGVKLLDMKVVLASFMHNQRKREHIC